VFSLAGLAVVLLISTLVLAWSLQERGAQIEVQQRELQQQPLLPVQSTHSVIIRPSRKGPQGRSVLTIGGGRAELADLKLDMSWSPYSTFHIIIDRVDQGRFAELGNVARDSNGHVRIALNSSALGPGDYAVTIEGLDKWGNAVPQAWTRFNSVR
jgi:hypothetical protein